MYLLGCKEYVTVVVPFKIKDQPKICHEWIRRASNIVELNLSKDNLKYGYILRNNHMVDNSEKVLAFKNGETNGTNACINYALKQNLGIKIIDL